MPTVLPPIAAAYLRTTNEHDPAGFLALFSERVSVHDAGREFHGLDAVRTWSEREIFAANVTLEVLSAEERDGETVVRTKVDGDFDRTGLPDPLIIDQHLRIDAGKIIGLSCRLATVI